MYRYLIFLIITTIVSHSVLSQIQTESPYSKLGFGLMENEGNIVNSGMGGSSVTLYKRNALNISNPAAISSIDTLSFVMEFGIKSNFSHLSATGLSKNSFSSNLNYFAFGFRGSKRWSASLGLMPISSRGYEIVDRKTIAGVGNEEKYYIGSGGINKLYLINSFDIFKDFSVGVSAEYLFGKLEETNTLMFPELMSASHLQEGLKQQISDFNVSFGLHYRLDKTEQERYDFGLSFTPKSKIKGKETYLKGITNGENIWSADDNVFSDTMIFYNDKTVQIEKPMSFTVGLGKTSLNEYSASIDYTFANWLSTNFENTKNSHRLALGYSFIPQWNSAVSYAKRSTYRFGAFLESTNISISDTEILNFGIAAGVGLPIRRGLYNVDIDLQLGQMGTNKNDQIKDHYIRLNLKLRFSEMWFYKPKYD
ncbi:MAG: hypothetical protein GX311_01870 [Bacteroidales bacterium]|jgi:hypothetical protein|nr:hypothetical protein [Bacteroidales bacterium]